MQLTAHLANVDNEDQNVIMKTKIPSPVLARIQLMFQSGATLDEVAVALDLDTSREQASKPDPVMQKPAAQKPVAAAAPMPVMQPVPDARMPRLEELTTNMESHVSSLLERDDVRDIPALSGSLDAIFQHVAAIRKVIDAPAQNAVSSVEPAAAMTPAKKATSVSKNPAIEDSKAKSASATPPPMKVQPPAKKIDKEKLRPTGELPTAGNRRGVAHPFAASLSGKDDAIQAKARPEPQATVESPPGQPVHAYRDRIAMAMSQINTIADEHDRDEDYIAVRHS